jgi:hypothetical protein
MKQTAVEYLIDQLDFELELYNSQWVKLEQTFEKAKEMEKQQIIDAWINGNDNEPKETTEHYAEQHYNETFKSK